MNPTAPSKHLLQDATPFSQSLIWDLQRKYYEEMGSKAWRAGEVPHYVTSNLRQANAYAEMAVALHKDYKRQHPMSTEPIHILELGGGSGRFSYYLLRRLQILCEYEGISFMDFHYILTDFTQSNLDFWCLHPRFQPYFESGLLDIALFDVTRPAPLELQISGVCVGPGDWNSPAVVIANYVWDSIPQELLYVSQERFNAVNVALTVDADPSTLSSVQMMETMHLEYAYASVTPDWIYLPVFQPILNDYALPLEKAWLLFPTLAIQCLEYVRRLSQKGILLLTADKGAHQLEGVLSSTPPSWASHGSISMNVNYHALVQYCKYTGGQAFFPDHTYYSINTGCLMLLSGWESYRSTWQGCRKYLDATGPDTYFTLYKCVRAHLASVQIRDILAALRLSLYDSHQLSIYSQRIVEITAELTPTDIKDLLPILHGCWENYFPLAEDMDLPTLLGSICYSIGAYEWAIYYFEHSTDIYGSYTGTFFNIAVCHYMLGNEAEAQRLLQIVVTHDPENSEAHALLATYLPIPTP
jgi:hypothetical protein